MLERNGRGRRSTEQLERRQQPLDMSCLGIAC